MKTPQRTETLPPPSDSKLEASFLGAMLLEKSGLQAGISLFRSNHEVFYEDKHQYIFQAICKLYNVGKAVDILTVTYQLKADGRLDQVGGAHYIAQLTFQVNGTANLQTHGMFLMELYSKRKMADVARRILAKAYTPTYDAHQLISDSYTEMNTLHDVLQIKRPKFVRELLDETVDKIEYAAQQPGGLTGVTSGLTTVDRITGGWQAPDLIIVAARPSMGKTTWALYMARAAATAGLPGVFFSLEMSDVQLITKMIGTVTAYSTSRLTRGDFRGGLDEARTIRPKAEELRHLPMLIDQTPGLSIGEFRAKATKLKAEQNIRWIVVDYLQLMTGDRNGGSREQEVASISRALKEVAKELNVPVLALSQLSREVAKRDGEKEPVLSDLRESGSIEQDADVVAFVHRPEYFKIMEDSMGVSTANTTKIIFAKHRNGPLEDVVLFSDLRYGRYEDMNQAPAALEYSSPTRIIGAGGAPGQADDDDQDPF